jgi:4-amino-4-deoxychorismate lyase
MLVHGADGTDSFEPAPIDDPQISVLDLGITRGDGIFESIGVVDGRAQAVEPHLDRLARSATMLDLPQLDLGAWRSAVQRSVDLFGPTDPGTELLVKLVYTRGIEDGVEPTGWVLCFDAGTYEPARSEGIAVITLDRGYRSDVATTSPWLLQGAKTLSYAVNKAVLREAARRGADDVIFVSSDGIVLEGPTSTVIALIDGVYVTTPDEFGVLPGTTQHAFFQLIEQTGGTTAYQAITVDRLRAADAVWLVSSGRQIAAVTSLDGEPIPHDAAFTADALTALLAR